MGLIEETAPAEAGSLTATGLSCVWRLLESRVAASPAAGLPVEHVIRLMAAANLGHRLVRAMHGLAKVARAQVCYQGWQAADALLGGCLWSP